MNVYDATEQAYKNGYRDGVNSVKLVRCKDCHYGELDDPALPNQRFCKHNGCDWNDENHFCSYGERRGAK